MEPNAHLERGSTMSRFRLTDRVTLTPEMLSLLDADPSAYALGYIDEIAEATGVPTSGTLYRVRWYNGLVGLRTIFRESELVPVSARDLWRIDALRTVQDDTFTQRSPLLAAAEHGPIPLPERGDVEGPGDYAVSAGS
jgi:hypothetical protein